MALSSLNYHIELGDENAVYLKGCEQNKVLSVKHQITLR